ncbi:MAG TPA: DUF1684 domain-containing protein [Chloroflexota bacterium]|nr:DUF1684 domain-containing protein [Chloroflexota bacterium]
MTKLEEFRLGKDHFFAQSHGSPLTDKQRRRFAGLEYYPENPDLVIEAALEVSPDRGTLTLEATGGDARTYRRAGIVHFTVDGKSAQLTLFEADEGERLFLPFRDATSGKETYGAGRYLEVSRPQDGCVVVDFNYADNPYCAYNAHWSCPLPPHENWLAVPIRAGEKAFPNGEQH